MNVRAATTDVLLGSVPIALLVALWQGLVSFGYAPATLLPPPGRVFERLAQQLLTATFQEEIAATLFRLFAGFAIAVILGVSIGLAAAASPAVNAVVRPIVRVLAPLPKVALYPALLLLLGFGHESKITLVAADALFPILLSTYYGASTVEQKLIWSAMAAGTPAPPDPVQGGAAGRGAFDSDRLPHRPCHFLHRGVPGRDDHLDRRPRPCAGYCGPHLSGRRHVRAADHDLAVGIDPQRLVGGAAVVFAARVSGSLIEALEAEEISMLADRIEAKWIDAFCEIFERCAVKSGDTAAILSETQSRALNVHLAELALLRMGARPFHIIVPTPRNRQVVPIRSTGASEAIQRLAPVVTALQQAGFVVDCTIEGLMHAVETPEILKAGARILVISNEHPEALERMVPDIALEKRVRAAAKMLRGTKAHARHLEGRHRSRRRHGRRLDRRRLGLDR